jgi:hypothetical protein
MKSLMISSMTRNQDDIESKTTTLSRIEQVPETTTSSKAQNAQIIKTSSKRDTTSSENLNVNVQSDEYERFLTTKKKSSKSERFNFFANRKIKNDQLFSLCFFILRTLKKLNQNRSRWMFEI